MITGMCRLWDNVLRDLNKKEFEEDEKAEQSDLRLGDHAWTMSSIPSQL